MQYRRHFFPILALCMLLLWPLLGRAAPRVLVVIAATNYLESEYEGTRRALESAGIQVEVASNASPAQGYRFGMVTPDLLIEQADADRYDAIAVVGGVGAREALWNHAGLQALLRDSHARGRVVAALCAAPPVLAKAGLLKGAPATMWPDRSWIAELEAGGARYVDEPVVVSGRVITGRDPRATHDFGQRVAQAVKPAQ